MKCVICKHPGDNGKYLFQLPDSIELDVDSLVVVETSRGEQPAVCITGTFYANPETIGKHWGGANRKITRVLKVMREFPLPWPEKKEETKTTGSIEDEDDSD